MSPLSVLALCFPPALFAPDLRFLACWSVPTRKPTPPLARTSPPGSRPLCFSSLIQIHDFRRTSLVFACLYVPILDPFSDFPHPVGFFHIGLLVSFPNSPTFFAVGRPFPFFEGFFFFSPEPPPHFFFFQVNFYYECAFLFPR